MENQWIPVMGEVAVLTSKQHRFGTDAMLLSHFAAPAKGETVCELGTGCGAIALRFCAGWQPAAVHGIDISPEAIALARQSAAAFGGTPSPTFAVGDWENPRELAPAGSFRRVVCNPPYFSPASGGVSKEQSDRLARHEKENTLSAVCRAAAWLLCSSGRFCLCHRPERLPAVLSALQAQRLEPKRLQPVQQRQDTAPWLFLLEARKDARPGLTWEPPLVLQQDDGSPSPAYRTIYGELSPKGR